MTGLFGSTGGVSNTGSTTIGADTDADSVGVISLQTRNIARLTIDNDGDVGIGTSSPATDFHLHNSSYPRLKLTNTATGSGALDGIEIAIPNTGDGKSMDIANYEQGDIRLYTGGTLKMRIDNDGFVGIGKTTPTTKLDVSDKIRVSGNTWPLAGEGLEFGYSPGTKTGTIISYDRDSGTTGPLHLGTGGVGIGPGATNPQHMLQVDGNAAVTGDFAYTSARTYNYQFPASAFECVFIDVTRDGDTWIPNSLEQFIPDFILDPANPPTTSQEPTGFMRINYWMGRNVEVLQLLAPVNLPDGAEIVSLKGYFYGGTSRSISLQMKNPMSSNETTITSAASSYAGSMSLVQAVESTIVLPAHRYIDNSKMYTLRWWSTGGLFQGGIFTGATIVYKVDHVGY
ncbi:MAG: hypothetical protein GY702_12740 [Desulfobulbaceae bacterium]|nr:hypothetical protein [Desulfobulbaceae bacterium]